ncbi:MAG: DUF2796 domain-containing protein [Gammaproteobacteria bacterium]|nr:DUF2796 domain-containing protein [Gammaproteobacteria bacterium]
MDESGARLEISIDGRRLDVLLTSSAAHLFALDAQEDDQARQQVMDSGAALLGDANSLFHLPSAAACRLLETTVGGKLLDEAGLAASHRPDERLRELRRRDVPLGGRPAATDEASGDRPDAGAVGRDPGRDPGHLPLPDAEIVVHHRYECQRPDMLTQLGAQIFSAFPALQRLHTRVQHASGQPHETLLAPQQPVLWLPPRP